jgi:hypothetical protein
MTETEILSAYPDLERDDVAEALRSPSCPGRACGNFRGRPKESKSPEFRLPRLPGPTVGAPMPTSSTRPRPF